MNPVAVTKSDARARVPGNSSQVSDGAAAVLIGRWSAVEALGLPVLGVLRASAVVGVPPDVMGIGPAFAIPAALDQAGKMVPVLSGVTVAWLGFLSFLFWLRLFYSFTKMTNLSPCLFC